MVEMTQAAPKGIKALVGRRLSKETDFLDEKINIRKLSVAEVIAIQEASKAAEDSPDETAGFEVLRVIIRSSVEGGAELTDDDFKDWPMDELAKLSNAIMVFSGLGADAGKSS